MEYRGKHENPYGDNYSNRVYEEGFKGKHEASVDIPLNDDDIDFEENYLDFYSEIFKDTSTKNVSNYQTYNSQRQARNNQNIRGRYARNNPLFSKAKGKIFIVISGIVLLITIAGGIKWIKNARVDVPNVPAVVSVLENIEDRYAVHDGYINPTELQLEDSLSSGEVMCEYFIDYFTNPDISYEEKVETLNNFQTHRGQREEALKYVGDTFGINYKEVPSDGVDKVAIKVNEDKLNAVVNNEEVMALIDKYSELFQVDKSILVGLAANSNGSSNNYMNITRGWLEVGDVHNVYTIENGQVVTYNLSECAKKACSSLEDNIKYAAMILAFRTPIRTNDITYLLIDFFPTNSANPKLAFDEANKILKYISIYQNNDEHLIFNFNSVNRDGTVIRCQYDFSFKYYIMYLENIYNEITNMVYNSGVELEKPNKKLLG